MEKKKSKRQNNLFYYTPIFFAVAALIVGIVTFVAEPSFIGLFNIRASSFEDSVKIIEGIDAGHNISFSDYSKGIEYLSSHPRIKNPLNLGEINVVLKEYSKVYGDESVRLFVDFRKNLLEAEKYYKLSQKTYKSNLFSYGLSCKNKPDIVDSIRNQSISMQKLNSSLSSLLILRDKYPDDFALLNISEKWINFYTGTMEDFKGEMDYKVKIFNDLCSKSAGNISD